MKYCCHSPDASNYLDNIETNVFRLTKDRTLTGVSEALSLAVVKYPSYPSIVFPDPFNYNCDLSTPDTANICTSTSAPDCTRSYRRGS